MAQACRTRLLSSEERTLPRFMSSRPSSVAPRLASRSLARASIRSRVVGAGTGGRNDIWVLMAAYSLSMAAILLALYGLPRSLRKPKPASSSLIFRRLRRSPLTRQARRRRLASATTSGRSSAWLLRPSHLPRSLRCRSRARLGVCVPGGPFRTQRTRPLSRESSCGSGHRSRSASPRRSRLFRVALRLHVFCMLADRAARAH
jgi:hypothetical protein